ncbi:MAG: DUF5666 domain-containing protein [Rhodospirillaceae bacterium]
MGTKRARTGTNALQQFAAAAFALVLVSACATPPSESQTAATNGDGISGTGIIANMHGGDGIGGTGVLAQHGGDGIGGTGIIGTISGFGSIIVNGLKLDYNAKTTVESDGRPAGLTDLKIGQVIEGVAQRDQNGVLRLERLEIRHAVTGPISRIDHNADRLVVLGQTVRVNLEGDPLQKAAFGALKVGDTIRVSGLRLEDGVIVASRLDQTSDDGRAVIRGHVTSTSSGKARIGDLDINLDRAALAENLTVGAQAFVAGQMRNGAFAVDVAIAKPNLPFEDTVTEVFVEGYVPSTPSALSVQGIPVTGLDLPADVKPGDRVVVTGRIGSNGTIAAREIERVRTVITVLRPSEMMRPVKLRPTPIQRPERIERQRPIDRPNSAIPERPQRERPDTYRPPMV